jgi:hypothetical protein
MTVDTDPCTPLQEIIPAYCRHVINSSGRGRGAQGSLSPWSHTSSLALTNPGAAERLGSHSLTYQQLSLSFNVGPHLIDRRGKDPLCGSVHTALASSNHAAALSGYNYVLQAAVQYAFALSRHTLGSYLQHSMSNWTRADSLMS